MPNLPEAPATSHSWLYRRSVTPLIALLRLGATPEHLAWSLAVGLLVGINPLLGSTTLVCLAVALIFRLNIAASQITNHLVYPLELALVVPFLRLGSRLFRTAQLPVSAPELLHRARTAPFALTRDLWSWEWHALVVWLLVACVCSPILAALLTPLLRRILARTLAQPTSILPEA